MIIDFVPLESERRGPAIGKWLSRVGLSTNDAAAVTTIPNKRLISWITCEAKIPDGSWSELSSFFYTHANQSTDIAVLRDADGVHPLEIVTRGCYVDHIVARDNRSGVVSIYSQANQFQPEGVSYQLFDAGVNADALAKMEAWAVELRTCGDEEKLQAAEINRGLIRMALQKHLRQSFVKMIMAAASEHRDCG